MYVSHVIQYHQVFEERDFFLIWKKLDNFFLSFVSSLKSVRDKVDPDVMEVLLLCVEVGRDTELIDWSTDWDSTSVGITVTADSVNCVFFVSADGFGSGVTQTLLRGL